MMPGLVMPPTPQLYVPQPQIQLPGVNIQGPRVPTPTIPQANIPQPTIPGGTVTAAPSTNWLERAIFFVIGLLVGVALTWLLKK
jgi:hypothetical protein